MRRYFVSLVLLAGCPDRPVSELVPEQEKVEPVTFSNQEPDLDLLFLIDKSPTMGDEQTALTANFPRFMQLLSQNQNGLPNLHVGVISQDLGAGGFAIGGCTGGGDDGKLLAQPRIPGCSPPGGNFIEDVETDGRRIKNYNGTLEETFSCIATLGPDGCGFEQHLGSLKKALTHPANQDFFRPDAVLAIVIISDEDDCSAVNPHIYDPAQAFLGELGPLADFRCFEWGWECDQGTMARTPGSYTNCRPRTNSPYLHHPDDFIDFVKSTKKDPDKKIVVATLTGPTPEAPKTVDVKINSTGVPAVDPSCTNGNQKAFPMPRLAHFASAFSQNTFYPLCNNDLSVGLQDVARLITDAFGTACFKGDLDTTDVDPANPGIQPECQVSEVTDPDTDRAVETQLKPCMMADANTPAATTPQPCWYIKSDPVKCELYPTKLLLETHPPMRATPPNTHVIAQCVTR